uniref:EGF-like domain-containing protein n=1 Tax=Steinernema glaseri TaxID=37863 RepID=A0A1I7ZSD3_9BILA
MMPIITQLNPRRMISTPVRRHLHRQTVPQTEQQRDKRRREGDIERTRLQISQAAMVVDCEDTEQSVNADSTWLVGVPDFVLIMILGGIFLFLLAVLPLIALMISGSSKEPVAPALNSTLPPALEPEDLYKMDLPQIQTATGDLLADWDTVSANENGTDPEDKVLCADGLWYPFYYACSGQVEVCSNSCLKCDEELAFTCVNASGPPQCILREKACNGIMDCADGSDEANCSCEGTNFQCSIPEAGVRKCLKETQLCDGFKDCIDGEDEEKCDSCSANPKAFYCGYSRTCLLGAQRCNGRPDCADHSDEMNCTSTECGRHAFGTYLCENSKQCFRIEEVCVPETRCFEPTEQDILFCSSRAEKLSRHTQALKLRKVK